MPRRCILWLWQKVCPVQELEYEQSKYNQKHEEGNKVVGQEKEGNEESDHDTDEGIRLIK